MITENELLEEKIEAERTLKELEKVAGVEKNKAKLEKIVDKIYELNKKIEVLNIMLENLKKYPGEN